MNILRRAWAWIKERPTGVTALVIYTAAVVLANVLTAHLGLVPMGFGLVATAGTYTIGGAYLFRDLIQRWLGKGWVWGAMLAGAGLSYWLSTPKLAVASGVTFLVAEALAYTVFRSFKRSNLLSAIFSANAVGVLADTFIFLYLAGFPITRTVVEGQLLGKWYVTAAVITLRWSWSFLTRRRPQAVAA